MNDNDKERKIYISHSLELLLWLIVVFFVVAISSTAFIFKQKNEQNDYHIYLQDVDGLIVGSPVRMMGIDVGYVTKIKPTNKEIYVKFILTNPDVYIPQGTQATVEFFGLAGSKSLELYLPTKSTYIDDTVPIITVLPPKRLHDALGLLNEMFKKLNSIIYSTTAFGSKMNDIKTNENVETVIPYKLDDFIKYSNDFLIETENKTSELRPLWKKGVEHVK